MFPRLLAASLLLWQATSAVSVACAADDSVAFLDALRERGHLDLALDYIDRLEQEADTPDGLRTRLAYERAVTLLEQSQTLASPDERRAAVSDARGALESFIEGGDPRLAAEASMKLAGALASSAARDAASVDRRPRGEQSQTLQDARRTLDESREYYARAEELLQTALQPLASVQPGSPEAQQRLQLRFQLAQARLSGARALKAKAETYPEDSAEFKQMMDQAATTFAGLYEKYDTAKSAGIGFYAHLYEGQCYLALGKLRLAENCFELLSALPTEEPSLRRLATLGHTYRTISLARQDKHQRALEAGDRFLRTLPRAEQTRSGALELKYQLAEAAVQHADGVEGDDDRQQLLRTARAYYQDAARGAGEHQAEARAKLAQLNASDGGGPLTAETFDEAYQVGLSAMMAAQLNAEGAPPGTVQEAIAAFRQSLTLAGTQTPTQRLNDARTKLATLYYQQEEYDPAAVLSAFVATKHPDDPSAKYAARLAMASLDQLRRRDQTGAAFANAELSRVAEFATRRWQDDPLADTAFGVLISAAIKDDRLDDAREVLEGVSPERRGAFELKLAVAAWEQARAAGPAAQADAATALRQALQSGGKAADSTSATAALLLAQAELSQGDAEAALAALQNDQYGPLTLVEQGSPAVSRAGFAAETHRTALQAYLSTTPPRTSDAMRMMTRLEESSGDKASLTRVYFTLGVQLERQIESLNQAGKTAEAGRVGEAFAGLIQRIGESSGQLDWTMQQWLSQTYLKLGEQFTGEQREKMLNQARQGFSELLDRVKADPAAAPSTTAPLAVQMQLGRVLTSLGQHEQAVDTFGAMLAERQMMLDVQKSAALALEQWGASGEAQQLDNAIRGARPGADGKNVIWGWSKLAQIAGRAARSQPKYRDLYFEAWLHVARCRYLAGEQATGAAQQKQFDSARRTILLLSRQYPELGGGERRGQFDALMKKIQTAEGDRPVGLAEFATNS